MLSRVDDTRVFESSEDVVLRSSSRPYSLHQQLNDQQLHNDHPQAEEDEQLHPQHPYRMQKRVLQRNDENPRLLEAEFSDKALLPYRKQVNRPMEFVFLSSGEIRAREDCPPGLGLPKLQQEQRYSDRRLEYLAEESSEEEEGHVDRKYGAKKKVETQAKIVRQRGRRLPVGREQNASSPSSSSSSSRSMSSDEEDADVSSDDSEIVVSEVSEESVKKEKSRASNLVHRRRQPTRNAESQVRKHESSRSGAKRTPTRSLTRSHFRIEVEDEDSDHEGRSAQHVAASHEKTPSGDVTPRGSRQRPDPLESVSQVSQLEGTNDAPARRAKRSPKMEVSHLNSEEPTPKPNGRTTSRVRSEEKMTDRLQAELQKEKKRMLENMTHLLEEQGKNQRLRDRVEALEAQLAAKDDEARSQTREVARELEKQTQLTEKEQAAGVAALEQQVRLQETKIARLKRDKDQLKTAVKQLKMTENTQSNEQRSDPKEIAVLRAEMDNVTRRLHEFLTMVERWKNNSKDEMSRCDNKTDLSAMLDRVWLDFPQFTGISAKSSKGSPSSASDQLQQVPPGSDDQADAVLFLKKRLRQREDELRLTHVKYVELKELCARQCVREADLQNFINEHRLRGNLIIPKNSDVKPTKTDSNQDQEQEDHQDEHPRSAKLKMISSRGTNTPVSYNNRDDDDDDFVNDEYSDNQANNDEYGEEEDEYPVRTPKVFVQVGSDGVYEHASLTNSAVAQKLAADRSRGKTQSKQQHQQQRVERIRLVPSPSLAQRYERVPTPTTSTTRRKKSTQQPVPQQSSRSHPPVLGECPSGCGSRLSFMRRKTSSAAARTKPVKRPVSATSSKGAIGVIRPWM